ncbi:MAG: ester cyclase [Dehalococcoidia bacterium]|nr:ester cyclase [Dehalococcoidia bacterium]
MSAEHNRRLVERWVEEAVNGRNLAVLDEIVAEDMVNHEDVSGLPGRAGFRATMERMQEMLPDQRMEPIDIIATDDTVVVRLYWIGTPRDQMMGRPVNGATFKVTHHHTFRVKDGKLAEHWANRDDLGMWRQLGYALTM